MSVSAKAARTFSFIDEVVDGTSTIQKSSQFYSGRTVSPARLSLRSLSHGAITWRENSVLRRYSQWSCSKMFKRTFKFKFVQSNLENSKKVCCNFLCYSALAKHTYEDKSFCEYTSAGALAGNVANTLRAILGNLYYCSYLTKNRKPV